MFHVAKRSMCAAALALLAACGDSDGVGTAHVTMQMTDGPDSLLQSASVTIGAVELLGPGGGPRTIVEDAGTFDLLALQNGVTVALGDATIPAGRYTQLRLIVTDASVTLKTPYTFTGGSATAHLTIPSGAQSGIKVNLRSADGGAAGAELSGETDVLVDFDVAQNFVQQGAITANVVQGILFTPLLRAVVRSDVGSIAGHVTVTGGAPKVGATVTATLQAAGATESLETTTASAITDATGSYTIRFLVPGTYAVTVDGLTSTPATRSIALDASEAATGADFSVP